MLDASVAFLWTDGMQNHTYLDEGVTESMTHAGALGEILEAITRAQTTAELAARLEACDVLYAPVNRVEALHRDPQVVDNGPLVETEHPSAGRMRAPRPAARFAGTSADPGLPAPALGSVPRIS